ncbi:MAG: hypothetical protein ACK6D2_18080 [Planctomycetota bacterium]
MHAPIAFALAAAVAAATAFAPQDPRPAATPTPAPATVPAETAWQDELAAIRRSMLAGGRAEAAAAAPRVRALGAGSLSTADREAWVRVARDVALRLGDRKWLEELRDVELSFGTELSYAVMLANAQLSHANLTGAKATLDALGDVHGANEREKRRVFALRARVAELEGDVAGERAAVEDLVDHLFLWPRQKCQECHATTKEPDVVTTLPIASLWFGERFVALMQLQGDAAAVLQAAEAELAKDGKDDDARIRAAYARRALGRADAALARVAELPWALLPGRAERKPRQFATYP